MKKILLATTFISLSAGYASADISWSANAAAGLAQDCHTCTWADDFYAYSELKLSVKASAETDGGLTFSAASSLKTGEFFARGGDLGDGWETKSNDEDNNGFGTPTISIGGAFGTVSFAYDDLDFYDDANGGADVKYEGTFGAITVGAIVDTDYDTYSAKLGYSADGISVNVDTDSYEQTNASVGYTMGAITGTLSTDSDYGYVVNKLKLAYSADAISASVKVGDDDSYDLSVGYTANGLAVTAEIDEDDYTKVTGSYDLGGGLSVEAGADSEESAYVGAAMKF